PEGVIEAPGRARLASPWRRAALPLRRVLRALARRLPAMPALGTSGRRLAAEQVPAPRAAPAGAADAAADGAGGEQEEGPEQSVEDGVEEQAGAGFPRQKDEAGRLRKGSSRRPVCGDREAAAARTDTKLLSKERVAQCEARPSARVAKGAHFIVGHAGQYGW